MNHQSNNTFALGALCGVASVVLYLLGYKDAAGLVAFVSIVALAGSLVMFLAGERCNKPPK